MLITIIFSSYKIFLLCFNYFYVIIKLSIIGLAMLKQYEIIFNKIQFTLEQHRFELNLYSSNMQMFY